MRHLSLDPLALVGWWTVTGTDQAVLFDPARFEIHDSLAVTEGTWRGDAGARFIATFDSIAPRGDNPEHAPTRPPGWLDSATSFALDGRDRVLCDRGGAEVARLTPREPGRTSGWADPNRPPAPEQTQATRPSGAVTPDLEPATASALVGHWTPAGFTGSTHPWVTIGADGTWTGTDGCNRASGRWVLGDDGDILTTASARRTLIACDGVDVGTQIAAARWVAVEGVGAERTLVLLGVAGQVVGRFAPS